MERRRRVRELSPHRHQEWVVRERSPHCDLERDNEHEHRHRDSRPHRDDGGEDCEHRRQDRDRRPHHHDDGGENSEHRRRDSEHRRRDRDRMPHHQEQEHELKTGRNQLDEEDDHASLDATKSTRYLVLHNIFDPTVQEEKEFYLQIQEEVHTKCALEEAVFENIHIMRKTGDLCLRCDSKRSAEVAKISFDGSSYNGRSIKCIYMEEKQYNRRF